MNHSNIALLLVICIFAVFIAGCSGISAQDQEFHTATVDGFKEMGTFVDLEVNDFNLKDFKAIGSDGKRMETRATAIYTKLQAMPVDPQFSTAKDIALRVFSKLSEAGKNFQQSSIEWDKDSMVSLGYYSDAQKRIGEAADLMSLYNNETKRIAGK